jgi:CarD family transcriptional regulator, regulator of rRNA transcription
VIHSPEGARSDRIYVLGARGFAGVQAHFGEEVEPLLYEVGDKVVYPHHGAGTITSRDMRVVGDQDREYLTIQILHNDMTVTIPLDSAERVGLRKVIGEETVEEVLTVLQGDGTKMPKNWNRRFKHNRDKMKTGDIFEMAEVVRNLAQRDQEKGLSTGEKQMFSKAKRILASELMYAKNMDEDEAREFLEEVLEEIGEARKARA